MMKPLRDLLLVLGIPMLLTTPVTALFYRYGIARKKCVSWSALCILLICNHSSAAIYPDLANNILTNTIASTNGLTFNGPDFAGWMFTFIQYPNGTNLQYTVNANWWFEFSPQRTASSCVKWTGTPTPLTDQEMNGTGQEDVNLIAPCYALTCQHAATGVGTYVGFIDDNGALVVKQVIATANVLFTNTQYSDVELCVLDSDVPPTVHPYKLFANPSVTNYVVSPVLLAIESKHQDNGWGGGNVTGDIVNDYELAVDCSGDDYLGSNWIHSITDGDSGCPTTALVNTNLVLIGHWYAGGYYQGSIWNYAHYESQINAQMHYFSTNFNLGTDYQIQTVDLSQFQNYHAPSPPTNLHIEQ